MATPAESFWYAYGPQGVTRQLVNSTDSATVSTTNDPSTWTDTLTVAAPSASGSTPSCPAGTYYVTVQAAGGGYTDSVIIEVTVTAPTVTVTSPANGSVYQVGASVNVSASASATCGSLSLSSVTISANGTSIGTIDYPLTEGEPTTFTWPVVAGANVFTATAVYGSGSGAVSVTSLPVTALGGTVTVPDTAWNPDPVTVDEWVYGTETATCSLDGNGSGGTFATYSWGDPTVLYTDEDPGVDFWDVSNYSILECLVDFSTTPYVAGFYFPGFYYAYQPCAATVYGTSSGSRLGSIWGGGYIGGTNPPDPTDSGDVMMDHDDGALKSHQSTSGTAEKAVAGGGSAQITLTPISNLKNHADHTFGVGERIKLTVSAPDSWPDNWTFHISPPQGGIITGIPVLPDSDTDEGWEVNLQVILPGYYHVYAIDTAVPGKPGGVYETPPVHIEVVAPWSLEFTAVPGQVHEASSPATGVTVVYQVTVLPSGVDFTNLSLQEDTGTGASTFLGVDLGGTSPGGCYDAAGDTGWVHGPGPIEHIFLSPDGTACITYDHASTVGLAGAFADDDGSLSATIDDYYMIGYDSRDRVAFTTTYLAFSNYHGRSSECKGTEGSPWYPPLETK